MDLTGILSGSLSQLLVLWSCHYHSLVESSRPLSTLASFTSPLVPLISVYHQTVKVEEKQMIMIAQGNGSYIWQILRQSQVQAMSHEDYPRF